MKKSIVFLFSLFLLNFVSAQFFGGYNNFNNFSFSLTNFLDSPDAVLIALFLIIAAFVSFVLRKSGVFMSSDGQSSKGIVAVISFSVSLIAVWAINRSNFDLEGLFSGFGISGTLFDTLIWAFVLAAAVFIIWKLGSGIFFLILGLVLIGIVVFTDLIYSAGTALVIGIISSLVGLWLRKRSRKGIIAAGNFIGERYNNQKPEMMAQAKSGGKIVILGIALTIFGAIIGFTWLAIIGTILFVFGVIRMFTTHGMMSR